MNVTIVDVINGSQTVRDLISDTLKAQGIEEAAGVLVTLEDGNGIFIVSEDHPLLKETVETARVKSVEVRQSAEAGF